MSTNKWTAGGSTPWLFTQPRSAISSSIARMSNSFDPNAMRYASGSPNTSSPSMEHRLPLTFGNVEATEPAIEHINEQVVAVHLCEGLLAKTNVYCIQ